MSISQVSHRFVRNANFNSSITNRMANRYAPFQNTLTILKDKESNKELYLIGSTHSSQLLAERTKELIKELKPDLVYLQSNQKCLDLLESLQVKNQQELNNYNLHLSKAFDFEIPLNFRAMIFRLRLYPWLLATKFIKSFTNDFHPFIPGMEIKYAYQEAKKINAEIQLGGLELDQLTIQRLYQEKRMDLIPLLYRLFNVKKTYNLEKFDHRNVLHNVGGEGYAESMDRYRANWYTNYFSIIAPYQKKIFIDDKDLDIFHALYKCKGKKIVAVVNQWHVSGIENHWRNSTGTQQFDSINPIGDLDINKLTESDLVNDTLRKIYSKVMRSEPASYTNYITQYHSEVHEQERNRAVKYYHYNDSHMYDNLPYHKDDLGSYSGRVKDGFDVQKELLKIKKQ